MPNRRMEVNEHLIFILLLSLGLSQVGKPCLRKDGNCGPENFHHTKPRDFRCTRCRTKAAIGLLPDVALRLFCKGI